MDLLATQYIGGPKCLGDNLLIDGRFGARCVALGLPELEVWAWMSFEIERAEEV